MDVLAEVEMALFYRPRRRGDAATILYRSPADGAATREFNRRPV